LAEAYAAMDKTKLREDAQEGNRHALRIQRIIGEISLFQSALRMANAVTWAAFGALAFVLPQSMAISLGKIAGAAVVALFLVNILRALAIHKADTVAYAILLPLRFFLFPFSLLSRLIISPANAILRRFGVDTNNAMLGVSEDDIRSMVNRGGDVGSIDASEQEMINNIFEFNDKSAVDIGTHRTDIIAIDVAASREEIVNTFIEHELSRYPVYEEDIDNIIGVLYIKDILAYIFESIFESKDLRDDFNVRELMREPYIVPSSKKIDEIFEEMRKSKMHMAIVIDEYGGCEGLLTFEDLIEEIVGNIYDEYDEDETPDVEEIGDDKYMIQGLAEPADVAEALGIALPEEDFDTFGGFIIHLLDHIPGDDEKPSASYGGYMFRVYEVREKRIQSVYAEKEV